MAEDNKLTTTTQQPVIVSDNGTVTVTRDLGVIPSFWGIDDSSISGVKQAVAVKNTKHGLLASVPIICRGDTCPYEESCYIDSKIKDKIALKKGRCPIEIAAILERFDSYCKYFKIAKDDVVDMDLIKDMVDIEVQILRCDNKIAINGDFIEMVVAGVNNQGRSYERPEIDLALVQKEKLRKERYQILKLLNATRADRAKQEQSKNDSSKKAVDLIAKALELQEKGILKPVHEFVLSKDDYSVESKDIPSVEQKPDEEIPNEPLDQDDVNIDIDINDNIELENVDDLEVS